MTDKVQKIREGVKKLKSQLLRGACSSQIAMETMCKEEAYNEVLAILDSMQEEPVSEDLEEASKEWLIPQLDKSYTNYGEAKMMELTHFDGYAMLDAIEFGAKWQKEKEYTCYEEAFEDGTKWKKEKTIDKACKWIEENIPNSKNTGITITFTYLILNMFFIINNIF